MESVKDRQEKTHSWLAEAGGRMNLQDAIEQYAAMVIVGANAIQRLAEKEPGQTNPRFLEMLDELIDQAERLKAGSSDTSCG